MSILRRMGLAATTVAMSASLCLATAPPSTALAAANPPIVRITQPGDGATVTTSLAAEGVRVRARVPGEGRANGAGIAWVRITLLDPSTGQVVASVRDEQAPFVLRRAVADGTYELRATAKATADAGGRRAQVSQSLTVAAAPLGDTIWAADLASLELLNQARAAVGAGPLTLDAEMSTFAHDWSITMSTGEFEHSGGPWAENIAASWGLSGLTPAEGARRLHDLWMGSPPHYANLTNPAWTKVGIGIIQVGDAWYGTHVFSS